MSLTPHSAQPSARALPTVFIDRSALAMVQRLVGNASVARVSQVGGLLLGRISPGSRSSVVVSRFQSVPWDANRGGAPFLAPVHEKVLDQTFNRLIAGNQGALSVIGFWRTAVDGEGVPIDQDWELLQRYFGGERGVCFLLTPVSQSTSVGATYFFGFEGLDDSSVVELLLEYDNSAPVSTASVPAFRAFGEAVRKWSLTLCAGGLLSLAAVMAHLSSSRGVDVSSEASAKPRLELQAARVGDDFVIMWAHSTPTGRSFPRGKLTIEDSGTRKEFVFDRSQMAGARMLYQPMSQDVSFRLDAVTEDGTEITESTRAYIAVPPPAVTNPVTLMDTLAVQTPAPDLPPPVRPVLTKQVMLPPQRVPDEQWSQRTNASQSSKARLFQYSQPPRKVASVVPLPEPPQLNASVDLNRKSLVEIQAERFPGAPFALAAPPQAQPLVQREVPEGQSQRPPSPAGSAASISPPVPIQSPRPIYSTQVAKMLTGVKEVVVRVKIDASGRVTEAKADTPSEYPYPQLGQSAVAAARNWRFKPATLSGLAVPSETDLRFRFVR
ncbi:MAG TPA: TonB family protein [Bryobacteraceae bacterium]|nr:TonB family protein [Bryobacteraceae bacterium]